jgi:hypothetical protein
VDPVHPWVRALPVNRARPCRLWPLLGLAGRVRLASHWPRQDPRALPVPACARWLLLCGPRRLGESQGCRAARPPRACAPPRPLPRSPSPGREVPCSSWVFECSHDLPFQLKVKAERGTGHHLRPSRGVPRGFALEADHIRWSSAGRTSRPLPVAVQECQGRLGESADYLATSGQFAEDGTVSTVGNDPKIRYRNCGVYFQWNMNRIQRIPVAMDDERTGGDR